ncbi:MAG TPA: hypothetical protein PLI11_04995 [Clostridia bacterium]|jgi:hypothetical protein|nr:hypothetical protein [Clostridiaceae bacterium]HOA30301.1 hypothetical protein [Clostridia bacterium]HPZ52254.1 hypothetical protein [Clostridia bacterium]
MKRIVVLIIAILMFSILAHAEEGDRYEAELASIYMCNNAGDHVAQIDNAGAYVEFILDETTAPGVYKLRIYYAAALEGNNSHTLFIDDEEIERIMYPQSELGWSTFSEDVYVETEVTLPTGVCTLRLEKTEEDEGFAELDAIRLIPVTLYTPEPTPEPTETPIPTKTEAPKPTKTQETTTEEKDSFNTLFVVVPAAVVVLAALVIVLIVKKKGHKN